MEKKQYTTPKVQTYGTVKKITNKPVGVSDGLHIHALKISDSSKIER